MKTLALSATAALILMLTGCAQKNHALYNYGTYSQSYYAYKQDLTPEKQLELQKAIEEAIAQKKESTSGRVPPGMYANLGYLYLKSGEPKKAIENFNMEKNVYPESTHFMDRVIAKVQYAEGSINE